MNILLISQCSGCAINVSRRLLDQFAERCGDGAWQSTMTKAGLNTLRKLLKSSARRNTAVACHRIRGTGGSELLWIVGSASRFNAEGRVPTNSTSNDVLRSQDEDHWHYGECARLIAGMAALFHDFGKASQLFQSKLKRSKSKPIADPYRHEWVSLRLFQAVIAGCQSDQQWLERLRDMDKGSAQDWVKGMDGLRDGLDKQKARDKYPFVSMPPLARLVAWLILSHHRLPQPPEGTLVSGHLHDVLNHARADWNSMCDCSDAKRLKQNWAFKADTIPTASVAWRRRSAVLAQRLLHMPGRDDWPLDNLFIIHLARLYLIWGDHVYSSMDSDPGRGDASFALFANTYRDRGNPRDGELKQRLDEHLLGVERYSARIARLLPQLPRNLPRIARHRAFRKPSKLARFRWQDKAFEMARAIQASTQRQGFFGINMASTGCGKTLANARIMYALGDPQRGARFSIALGLRSLTLQTGDAYRDKLKIGSDDLAVLVGGAAVRDLHDMRNADAAASGSESAADMMDASDYVHYDGAVADGSFNDWLAKDTRIQKLLNAPILACTIDHLMPATEARRGGHHIAPMMRLLTADLVLDEPDDFDLADLPALTRLVHWAGLLGSRVLLSSATLPPALVQGLFDAYRAGRTHYQQVCGQPGLPLNLHAMWLDEFDQTHQQCADVASFEKTHQHFVARRNQRLKQRQEPRVRAGIAALDRGESRDRESVQNTFAERVTQLAQQLHCDNAQTDARSGKQVSFGVLRMAHIKNLYPVSKLLLQRGISDRIQLHLCCYHSRHPLLIRSAIEATLDTVLQRHAPESVFQHQSVQQALDASDKQEHVFLVAATPVCEVGRDHDYDWAIVEPSSMRSIIQLAGRVRRHRPQAYDSQNIALLDFNLAALLGQGEQPVFCRPGFESKHMLLNSHALTDLLTREQYQPLNARPRILERDVLHPHDNLVDLEHDRLRAQMDGSGESKDIPNPLWWQTPVSMSGWFQHKKPFRAGAPTAAYAWLPRELQDGFDLHYEHERDVWVSLDQGIVEHDCLGESAGRLWAVPDYEYELNKLAERLDIDDMTCAQRFGQVDLKPREQMRPGWKYHPGLGFVEL